MHDYSAGFAEIFLTNTAEKRRVEDAVFAVGQFLTAIIAGKECHFKFFYFGDFHLCLVGVTGVEPARYYPRDPKSRASANFATPPLVLVGRHGLEPWTNKL